MQNLFQKFEFVPNFFINKAIASILLKISKRLLLLIQKKLLQIQIFVKDFVFSTKLFSVFSQNLIKLGVVLFAFLKPK